MNATRRQFLGRSLIGAAAAASLAPLSSSAGEAGRNRPAGDRMKLGTVTYNLAKDWDLETLIKNCEATGFEGVELRTTHAHKVEIALGKDERENVRRRFANSKVALMGLGSAFEYHSPDPERLRREIAQSREYIVLAHDVGASGIKVRPNGLPKEVPTERTLEQIGRSLRQLGEFGADHGVAIRLEVHGQGTSLLPNIKTILDHADHRNVGACWNSNQSDLDGGGFDHNFDLVKDKIFSVHMRDLYLSEYPFRRLLGRLNEIHFDGFCLAEIPPSDDPLRVMRYFRALWLAYQGLQ